MFDAAGSFAVTAVYSGATGFEGSTSAPQSVAVSDPDVTTSLTVQAPATAVTGTSVDLTATVSAVERAGHRAVRDRRRACRIAANRVRWCGLAAVHIQCCRHPCGDGGVHRCCRFTNSTASAQTVTVSDPRRSMSRRRHWSVCRGRRRRVRRRRCRDGAGAIGVGGAECFGAVPRERQPDRVTGGSGERFRLGRPHLHRGGHTPGLGGVHRRCRVRGSASVDRPVVVSAPNPSDAVSSVVIVSTQSPTAGAPYVLKAQVIGAPSVAGNGAVLRRWCRDRCSGSGGRRVAELTHNVHPERAASDPCGCTRVARGWRFDVGDADPRRRAVRWRHGDTGSLDLGSLGSLSGFRFGF